jgi:SAM-dependent methyltransferase
MQSGRSDPSGLVEAVLRLVRRGGAGPAADLTDAERRAAARGVARLRAGLTGERALPGVDYLAAPDLAAAYLLYHAPLAAARAASVLAELPVPAGEGPVRVLDLGAGPGPLTHAALDRAAAVGRPARAVLTDASPAALELAVDLAAVRGLGPRVRAVRWRLPEAPPAAVRDAASFDWILAGHSLNELWPGDPHAVERRAAWLGSEVLPLLAPGGRLVLIEPALRETGRALLGVRDRLLADGGLVALAPCLVQSACPALAKERDWCHQSRPWRPPPLTVALSAAAGLDNDRLDFAYLVLARAADGPAPEHAADRFRVVSAPLPEKGKRVLWGCGPAGRERLVRLDRQTTETNAAFAALDRGDVAALAPLERRGDGLRVGAETAVTLVERPRA